MTFVKIALFILISACAAQLHSADRIMDNRFVPDAQTAAITGSWALWHNPAGLAFLGGGETSGSYLYEWSEIGNRHHGGLNFALNMLEAFSIGGGFNTQGAYSDQARRDLGTNLNGILGTAVRLGDGFGFGVSFYKSYNFLSEKSTPTLVTFGFQARPFRFLSLGAFYEEVHEGFFSAPNITAGISIRPYKEYVTIGLDHRWRALSPYWSGPFRMEPIASIKTSFGGFGVNVSAEIPGIKDGWTKPIFLAGLDINFSHLGIGLSSVINPSANNYAVGGHFRASTEEWQSVASPTGLWVELTIDSDGNIEQEAQTIAEHLLSEPRDPLSVLALLKRMQQDRSIEGIVLNLNGFNFGDGKTQEWREAIMALRRANKSVVIYLDSPSERDYYIATAANKILMNKNASLDLSSFRATLVYFADMLEKIGIKAEAIVSGSYKTAPRQWTHARPHKEEIEVTSTILNDFYDSLLQGIAKDRSIEKHKLIALFDQGEVTAQQALDAKLVDELVSPHNVVESLSEERKKPLPFFANYEHRVFKRTSWEAPKKIAVIPIYNEIVDGRITPGIFSQFFPTAGAKNIVEEIDNAAQDPSVQGIIIRIDSPGGDSLAGHRIHEAIINARAHKPIVASMGDVAASAGYLIAAGAHQVISQPNTITGSIGVFSLMFTGEKLAQKLGIFSQEISAVKNPGPTVLRSIKPSERENAQKVVDWAYQNFITSVSESLNLDRKTLAKNAEGRIWLGHQALERGLVHSLGGFSEAIDSVRKQANLAPDADVVIEIRRPGSKERLSLASQFITKLSGKGITKDDIKPLEPIMDSVGTIVEAQRINAVPQARLPFNVKWEKSQQD